MNESGMQTYIWASSDWKTSCSGKCILFDTNAIIALIEYKAQKLMEDLGQCGAYGAYIHPVQVELLATQKELLRLERSDFMTVNGFNPLPLTSKHLELAIRLQAELNKYQCQPEPTDLYLGSVLAAHIGDKMLILTGNVSDFPYPIYQRVGQIILQGNKSNQVLSLLDVDRSVLN